FSEVGLKMNGDFPRILTLLRKERGVSQKIAAVDLGVSQSLLSHYEKGIRECGLDFLIKTADYYGVSCDYLLGRSAEKTGSQITVDDIPEPDSMGKENSGNIMPVLNKKLIANSLNIIFDLLDKTDNDDLIDEVSAYLMLSVYKMFRVIYAVNDKNQDGFFNINKYIAFDYVNASMSISEANAKAIIGGSPTRGMEKIESPDKILISTEMLMTKYPLFSSSLLNLIKNAEYRIKDDISDKKD
ncbi:MAG: helix-turn-helix transcriptional regulator, partial [Oscillospiraceae bacterium]